MRVCRTARIFNFSIFYGDASKILHTLWHILDVLDMFDIGQQVSLVRTLLNLDALSWLVASS